MKTYRVSILGDRVCFESGGQKKVFRTDEDTIKIAFVHPKDEKEKIHAIQDEKHQDAFRPPDRIKSN